jgi:hypothetical protein
MNDYFGYNRQVHKSGQVISSQSALISFGDDSDKTVTLAQNVTVNYAHRVEPVYELGSDDVFYVTGQPSGTMAISRSVGAEGLLQSFGSSSQCNLNTINIDLNEEVGCVDLELDKGRGIKIGNAIAVNVGLNFGAGGLQISENTSFVIGSLEVKD